MYKTNIHEKRQIYIYKQTDFHLHKKQIIHLTNIHFTNLQIQKTDIHLQKIHIFIYKNTDILFTKNTDIHLQKIPGFFIYKKTDIHSHCKTKRKRRVQSS